MKPDTYVEWTEYVAELGLAAGESAPHNGRLGIMRPAIGEAHLGTIPGPASAFIFDQLFVDGIAIDDDHTVEAREQALRSPRRPRAQDPVMYDLGSARPSARAVRRTVYRCIARAQARRVP